MGTIIMFACLVSLEYPDYPEVCQITEFEQTTEPLLNATIYCEAVQHTIDQNPEEWDAVIAFCGVFDPERDLARLIASDKRLRGDVTDEEFDCLIDKSVRC